VPEPQVSGTKRQLWAGRIMSGLGVAFLLMDGVMKLFKPAVVREAFSRLGYPESEIIGIGVLLLMCTALYLIPRTSIFGALVNGLSGRGGRDSCAGRRSAVFSRALSDLHRGAPVGRALPA